MPVPSTKELTTHLLELCRVVKVMATKMARFYPSSETDEFVTWASRELDALRSALEGAE